MSWHVESSLLKSYATGEIDQVRAFSIEAHLTSCSVCRAQLAERADERDRLEQIWSSVVDDLDRPKRAPVEALLVFLRTPQHLARLLAATPSLSLSWLAAVAVALFFAVTAAHQGERGLLLFLMTAPLLPLAGVAAAYGPGIDPTYEIGLAAPMRSFRLLLVRAAAVLVSTTMIAGVAALFLPALNWTAAAWLLPSVGLTLFSLALATVMSPQWAAGGVAFVWVAAVFSVEKAGDPSLVAFRGSAQVAFLVITVIAALIVARRKECFDIGRES